MTEKKPSTGFDPDEVPELTREWFEGAAIYRGGELIRPERRRPDLFQMVSLRTRSSGLPMNIWIGPRDARYVETARIKVQTNHRPQFEIYGLAAVTIEDDPQIIEGSLNAADFALVRRYIALNKEAILDHWFERSDGIELSHALKPLTTR